MQAYVALSPVVAGDIKTIVFTIFRDGQDWTGRVVASKLRTSSPTGAIVLTFTPVLVTIDSDSFTATLSLSSANTTALGPGTYYGDLVVSIPSTFGPYTPVQFNFTVTPRITS